MENTDLKKCKYCYTDIPKKATVCPNCKKNLKEGIAKHPIFSFIICIIFLSYLIPWLISDYEKTVWISNTVPEEIPTPISATDIFKLYNANEINADDLLKDKLVEINWKVGVIWKDILNSPYVTLNAWENFFSVQCMLKDNSKAVDLKKWDHITIIWKNTWKLWNIIIRDCYIK